MTSFRINNKYIYDDDDHSHGKRLSDIQNISILETKIPYNSNTPLVLDVNLLESFDIKEGSWVLLEVGGYILMRVNLLYSTTPFEKSPVRTITRLKNNDKTIYTHRDGFTGNKNIQFEYLFFLEKDNSLSIEIDTDGNDLDFNEGSYVMFQWC